jgi:hypothetical protein
MNPWLTRVPIFDGEDEDELKAEFVKFSALYPTYSPFEVGEHVFRNLPDPISRGQQAGAVWGKDLEIRERIRTYSATESESSDTNPENLIKAAWLIANDPTTESRDRVKAIELIAKMQGNLKKERDPDDGKKEITRPYSFTFVEKDFSKPRASDVEE